MPPNFVGHLTKTAAPLDVYVKYAQPAPLEQVAQICTKLLLRDDFFWYNLLI